MTIHYLCFSNNNASALNSAYLVSLTVQDDGIFQNFSEVETQFNLQCQDGRWYLGTTFMSHDVFPGLLIANQLKHLLLIQPIETFLQASAVL